MKFRFANEDLKALYTQGPTGRRGRKVARQLPVAVIEAFFKAMDRIAAACSPADLAALRGTGYHALKGNRAGQHALRLNDQFRLIVRQEYDEQEILMIVIEIVDYH